MTLASHEFRKLENDNNNGDDSLTIELTILPSQIDGKLILASV